MLIMHTKRNCITVYQNLVTKSPRYTKSRARNVRSSIKTTILFSKLLKKKTMGIYPHPLGNCLLLDPLPIGISDAFRGRGGKYKQHPGMEGDSFHFLMNLCTVCIHVIVPGVTASFSLNFLNSPSLLKVHVHMYFLLTLNMKCIFHS